MSYNKRKRKRLIKSSFRIAIISFIFIYLIFRSVPIFLANTAKTILPVEELVVNKISSEGVIIKNEIVYKAEGTGELDSKIKEGERVPAGIEIANINLLEDTSQLKLELIEIENSILYLSKTDTDSEVIQAENTEILNKQNKLIETLQIAINLGNYGQVIASKAELELYNTNPRDIVIANKYADQSLESLQQERDELLEKINSNNIRYYTTNSGIVSYNIDGFESLYLPQDFENYTYDKINIENINKDTIDENNVKEGSAVFKMIDNFQWYIAIKIEDIKDIVDYEINQNIWVQLENDEKEISGRIIAINLTDNKAVIVIRFNDYLHEFYNLRFLNVHIIQSKTNALKIPSKVVIEKDGQKGVYIKEINGIVKFRPIIVLSEDEDNEFTYIQRGDDKGYIQLPGLENTSKTVLLYDEIFISTNNIKEGQILN
jgi:putative membrane fusion protein